MAEGRSRIVFVRREVNLDMASSTSSFWSDGSKLFRWNWGAFLDPLGFGHAHRTYKTYLLALPGLVPCVLAALFGLGRLPLYVVLLSLPLFLVWNIGCGAMGEKMAWAVGRYEDGASFRVAMDSWRRAGWLHFVLRLAVLAVFAIAGAVIAVLYGAQLQNLAVQLLGSGIFPRA